MTFPEDAPADLGARRKVRKTLAQQPNVQAFAKRRRRGKPRTVDGHSDRSSDPSGEDSSDSKRS